MSGPYRLLFLDLDGTLVGRKDVITPRTLDALHRAQRIGCTVVICTGRSRYRTQPIADRIGGHSYGIILNGAVVFDWETGDLLCKKVMSLETAFEAVRLIRAFEMAPLCFGMEEDDRWIHTDRRFPVQPEYATANPERLIYREDLLAEMETPPISIEAYSTPEKAHALVKAWRQAFGPTISAFVWESIHFPISGANIRAAGADKALAAETVAETLGIPREQTLAIGDAVNDLELLRWAGLGVCMGDGHPEARACADHTTDTFAEDGAAQAIERFVLTPQDG